MKSLNILAVLGCMSWVFALPSLDPAENEVEAREPHFFPNPCGPPKHSTKSHKKTSSVKMSVSTSTKKISSTTSHKFVTSTKKTSVTPKPLTSSKPATSSTKSLADSSTVVVVSSSTAKTTSTAPILPETTISIPLPITSVPTVPVCVPNAGEAVTNGGFADGLTGWTVTNPAGDAAYSSSVEGECGITTDAGNGNGFRTQPQKAGTYTLTLSQTACLIPGTSYTYSYHDGILDFPDGTGGTGCTLAFSANDQQLVGPSPFCGGEPPTAGPTNVGICAEPGAGNGFLKNYYEQKTGTFVPTLPQVTIKFDYTCTFARDQEANLLDFVSITLAV